VATVELTAVAVDIDLPGGWARAEHDGPALLVAGPGQWLGALPPAVTVSQLVSPPAPSLVAYGDRLVASTMVSLGGRLVHAGVGHRPVDHVDLTIATEQWGLDVTVTSRHVVRAGGEAVVATGMAADDDWAHMAPVLMRVVRSLRPRTVGETDR
jgi:hypothetical protein